MAMSRRSLLVGAAGLAAASALPAAVRRGGFFARHRLPIGLQLYTLGDAPNLRFEDTLLRVARIGYRDIELPGLYGRTPAQVRAAADEAKLRISCLHLSPKGHSPGDLSLADEPGRVADTLRTLGAEDAVMPMMLYPETFRPGGSESFQAGLARTLKESGADIWKRTAAFLNERGAALKREGIRLGYHNHNLEFAPVGDTTGWALIASGTDPALVSFEVDAGWVASAGLDPLAFVKLHSGRLRQLHVKDVRASLKPNFALATAPTEVGSGTVDWKALLPAAYEAGVRHFYVEQEPPFTLDRFAAAARSFRFLADRV